MYSENETLGGAKWRLSARGREGVGKKMKKSEKKVYICVRAGQVYILSTRARFFYYALRAVF